ncbi:hypothetical protein BST61_g11077 [Cercospora zeina]
MILSSSPNRGIAASLVLLLQWPIRETPTMDQSDSVRTQKAQQITAALMTRWLGMVTKATKAVVAREYAVNKMVKAVLRSAFRLTKPIQKEVQIQRSNYLASCQTTGVMERTPTLQKCFEELKSMEYTYVVVVTKHLRIEPRKVPIKNRNLRSTFTHVAKTRHDRISAAPSPILRQHVRPRVQGWEETRQLLQEAQTALTESQTRINALTKQVEKVQTERDALTNQVEGLRTERDALLKAEYNYNLEKARSPTTINTLKNLLGLCKESVASEELRSQIEEVCPPRIATMSAISLPNEVSSHRAIQATSAVPQQNFNLVNPSMGHEQPTSQRPHPNMSETAPRVYNNAPGPLLQTPMQDDLLLDANTSMPMIDYAGYSGNVDLEQLVDVIAPWNTNSLTESHEGGW